MQWMLSIVLLATCLIAYSESAPVDVEVYTGPSRIHVPPPKYPTQNLRDRKEGWVIVNFMVDAAGKPYEPVVTDSTGDQGFEAAAVRAVMAGEFNPATIGGEPLDAGYNLKLKFQITTKSGKPAETAASREFASAYRRLMRAIERGNPDSIGKELERLESRGIKNLYEDAFLNFARYSVANVSGQEAAQRRALQRAIAHEDKATFLPPELYFYALKQLFFLQVSAQHYASALKTYGTLISENNELTQEMRDSLASMVEKIEVLAADDRAFAVTGEIGSGYSWFHNLLKDDFVFEEVEGELAEAKLRCSKRYEFFRIESRVRYHIPEQYGQCSLEVVGNPGTTFKMYQL